MCVCTFTLTLTRGDDSCRKPHVIRVAGPRFAKARLKQLALFWLLSAAVGFAAVAGMAVMLALAVDAGGQGVAPAAPRVARSSHGRSREGLLSAIPVPRWPRRSS